VEALVFRLENNLYVAEQARFPQVVKVNAHLVGVGSFNFHVSHGEQV
jgi:hypothetical protein